MKRHFPAAIVSCALVALLAFTLVARVNAAPAAPAVSAEPRMPAAPAAPATARFDAEAATAAYMATIPPKALARSDAYFEGGYWLQLWDLVVGLTVAWLLLGMGWSRRVRELAERVTRFKWLQAAVYGAAYIVLVTLLTLPWAAYEGYFREHQYGLSNQDLAGWLGDFGKQLVINLVFGAIAITVLYAAMRRLRRTWWAWGAVFVVALLAFQILISPILLEPVFNKFYPLADGPLKQQILSLARANEIPVTQVYEFDASKQTTRVSAHVSGLLNTAQISLNDNLVNRTSPEAIRAVLGHEMGHYVLNHGYKFLLPAGLVALVGFLFVARAFDRLAVRRAAQWGIRDVADPAGLPLLVALFSVYLFVCTPLLNTLTRTMEAEADAFGLNASRAPDGFAQAAIAVAEYRKMKPGPMEEFLLYDHPSGWNRIHRAMLWKAENVDAADIAAYDASHHPPGTAP
jgi:STE24 endopeptidase